MKKYKIFYALFVLLGMSLSFTACSDDDDEVSSSQLVGTWEATWEKGYEKWEDEIDEWDEAPEEPFRITFYEDGTWLSEYYYNGKWHDEENGTYSVKGNKIYVSDRWDDYEVTIVSITSSQLILEEKGKDADEEWYYKITYKRVK